LDKHTAEKKVERHSQIRYLDFYYKLRIWYLHILWNNNVSNFWSFPQRIY